MKLASVIRSVARVGVVFGVTGAAGGCEGAPTSGPTPAPTEIASVSAYGVKLTFLSASVGGKTYIGMQEVGSAFSKSSPVAALVAQGLTTQEIYLALAPEGATAPAALVAAQADEAVALGRSAAVQHVTVNESALVEKSLAACESTLLSATPLPGGHYWALGNSGTFSAYTIEGINATSNEVVLGTCNEGSNPVNFVGQAEAPWLDYAPIEEWSGTMGAYQYYYYYWTFYGCGFAGCSGGAYYQQSEPAGSSAWFDIVTAVAVPFNN